eukprot:GEMP01017661.1.p1 GENE.GEMP01017661.1~~GEMP01017661.1.p1  ORF type:complete len:596 (+),score=136.26 GEMP01017661.1:50-1789(+)
MVNQPCTQQDLDNAVEALVWCPSHAKAFSLVLSEVLGATDSVLASAFNTAQGSTQLLDTKILREWAGTYTGKISRTNANELLFSLETYIKSNISQAVAESSRLDLDASSFATLKGHGVEQDWLVWQHPAVELANKLQQSFPTVPAEILKERAQLCSRTASEGGIFKIASQAHVLTRLDEYMKFEASVPSRKEKTNSSILFRIVAEVLPAEALDLVRNANSIADVQDALKKMVEATRASNVVVPQKKEDAPIVGKKELKKNEGRKNAAPAGKPAPAVKYDDDALRYDEMGVAIRMYIVNAGSPDASKRSKLDPEARSAPSSTDKPKSVSPAQAGQAQGNPNFGQTWNNQVVGQTDYSLAFVATPVDFSTTFATPLPQGHTPSSWTGTTPASGSFVPTEIPDVSTLPEDVLQAVQKLDIRVGKIEHVEKAANADTLYLCKVDIGGETRQVVTSLVKHYKLEQLQNRIVVVYCNIKTGKMAGYDSEAMLLSAVSDHHGPKEICELLDVPAGTPIGSRIYVGGMEFGSQSAGVSTKNISKQWAKVQSKFSMLPTRIASLAGIPLTVTGGHPLTTPNLANCEIC